MNPVISILTRLGLEKYSANFEAARVNDIPQLRALTLQQLLNYVPNQHDCTKLEDAINRANAPVPGSANPTDALNHPQGKRHERRGNESNMHHDESHPSHGGRGGGYSSHGGRGGNASEYRGGRGGNANEFYGERNGPNDYRGGRGGNANEFRGGRGGGANEFRGGRGQHPRSQQSYQARQQQPYHRSHERREDSQYVRHEGVHQDRQHRGGYYNNSSVSNQNQPGEYKEDCPAFATPEGCPMGKKCPLAHNTPIMCRELLSGNGCRYGNSCRYSHDPNQMYNEPTGGRPHFVHTNAYEVTLKIPNESIKLLLASNAKVLREIHVRNNTSNARVEKLEDFQVMVNFTLYGSTKEGLEEAKKELEHFVGIAKKRDQDQRFDYYINEREHNHKTIALVQEANEMRKGTPTEISAESIECISSYLDLSDPYENVDQYYFLSGELDRHRRIFLASFLKALEGNVQAIIFGTRAAVMKLQQIFAKRKDYDTYGGATPIFLIPCSSKETVEDKMARMQDLEQFKRGTIVNTPKGQVLQRLLVCTDDYARYARRHVIPYVNVVIHFNPPRTRIFYLYRLMILSGRQGSNLIICSETEMDFLTSISEVISEIESLTVEGVEYAGTLLDRLEWETVDSPKTDFVNVEPKSENLVEEVMEKTALKERNKLWKASTKPKEKVVSEIDQMDEG